MRINVPLACTTTLWARKKKSERDMANTNAKAAALHFVWLNATLSSISGAIITSVSVRRFPVIISMPGKTLRGGRKWLAEKGGGCEGIRRLD